jgi:DNA modification methylase
VEHGQGTEHSMGNYYGRIFGGDTTRNWRTVWTIGPEANSAQHYAPFPRELARRCIVAGSRVGDVVLDPFAGTGTTVRVADGLGRKALGFDLGEKYVAQANERTGVVQPTTAKTNQQIGMLFGDMEVQK